MITILSSVLKGKEVYQLLEKNNLKVNYFDVNDYSILPCYSCNQCIHKTDKECISKDDTNEIMHHVKASEILIIIDQIIFGSYSYSMKRVIDKFVLLSDGFYQVKDKQLTKRFDGILKKVYIFGLQKESNIEEEEIFKNLINELLILTTWNGEVIVSSNILPVDVLGKVL